MKNNQQDSQFDNEQLLFRQMFLLPGDVKASYDSNDSQRRVKVKPNLLSIYAIAVTLLLVLSAQNSMADNKVTPQPDEARLASLEQKLEQSQTRMIALESKLISTVEAAIATNTSRAKVTSTEVTTPQVEPLPSVDINQLPLLPVTKLPPPSFFQTSPSVLPLAVPQPASPKTDPSALILQPQPAIATEAVSPAPPPLVTPSETELKSDAQSPWLGHTDAVYYSSAFESANVADLPARDNGNSSSTVALATTETSDLTSSLTADSSLPTANTNTAPINLELLTEVESKIDSVTELKPLFSDEDLAQYLSSAPPLDRQVVEQEPEILATVAQLDIDRPAESEVLDTDAAVEESGDLANKPAKAIDNSTTKSDSLFSDEELARRLKSAPLLEDHIVAQKLATAPTIAQLDARERDEQQIDATSSGSTVAANEVEVINLELLAKSDEDISQSQSSFSDEDLARYLSSTPLLDDKIIARKLGTTPKGVELEPIESAKNSSPPLTLGKIDVINLSLLSEIEVEQSSNDKSPSNEDLTQYLTAVP